MSLKPICVRCCRFYRPKVNGYTFLEGMPRPSDAQPGLRDPQHWVPYKLWRGDLWECPDCGNEIVSGFAGRPLAEHYMEEEFADAMKRFPPELQVNDC